MEISQNWQSTWWSAKTKVNPTRSQTHCVTCTLINRLYDPRSKEGVIVRSQFTSHDGWVTCLDWCAARQELFASGGCDNLVKMWDWRSCRTPLYDLRGHEDKVMCVDWGEKAVVASGGADNEMKLFKSNC